MTSSSDFRTPCDTNCSRARPLGRMASRMQRSAARWSGTQWSALNETTRSKASRYDRRVASPTSKSQVRVVGKEVLAGKVDHAGRWIDADHRAVRQALGDLRGDLAVTAADVQDALRSAQIETGEALVRQPLLQRRPPVVLAGVPLGHAPVRCRYFHNRARRAMAGPNLQRHWPTAARLNCHQNSHQGQMSRPHSHRGKQYASGPPEDPPGARVGHAHTSGGPTRYQGGLSQDEGTLPVAVPYRPSRRTPHFRIDRRLPRPRRERANCRLPGGDDLAPGAGTLRCDAADREDGPCRDYAPCRLARDCRQGGYGAASTCSTTP